MKYRLNLVVDVLLNNIPPTSVPKCVLRMCLCCVHEFINYLYADDFIGQANKIIAQIIYKMPVLCLLRPQISDK